MRVCLCGRLCFQAEEQAATKAKADLKAFLLSNEVNKRTKEEAKLKEREDDLRYQRQCVCLDGLPACSLHSLSSCVHSFGGGLSPASHGTCSLCSVVHAACVFAAKPVVCFKSLCMVKEPDTNEAVWCMQVCRDPGQARG